MPVIPVLFAIWLLSGKIRHAAGEALKEPETRGLVYGAVVILAFGTTFYRLVEGWTWVDSFYFAVVTLTTVGYGDVTPQTDAGKLFTTVYILVGLGILGGFVGLITEQRSRGFLGRGNRTRRPPAETTDGDDDG